MHLSIYQFSYLQEKEKIKCFQVISFLTGLALLRTLKIALYMLHTKGFHHMAEKGFRDYEKR